VILHGSYERGIPVDPAWSALIDAVPDEVRHLAIHDRHLVEVTERDRPYVTGELISAFTTTGTAKEVRDRVAAARDAGVTEIAYQPAGPDIAHELATFYDAVAGL
jgi:5,10-methylenetetrahydromethanopterin reductase